MPHVIDQIEAYIAGGLSPGERLEFDQHIASCAACAEALKESSQMDAAMNQMFALARPAGGFEDRLIQGLRNAGRRRRWVHPMVRRVATGVAAAILLGSVGYLGNAAMNGAPLPRWASAIQSKLPARVAPRQVASGGIVMNFHNAPASEVVNYVGQKLGYHVIQDGEVQGRVDITGGRPVNADEALIMLNAALRPNGYAAVQDADHLRTLRVINRSDAATANLPVKLVDPGSSHLPASDDLIAAVIPVKQRDAEKIRAEIAPLIPGATVSNQGPGTLIVTDSEKNVQRVADALADRSVLGRKLGEIEDLGRITEKGTRGDEGKLGLIVGKPAAQPVQRLDTYALTGINRSQRGTAVTDLSVSAPAAAPPITWNFETKQRQALDSYYRVDQPAKDQGRILASSGILKYPGQLPGVKKEAEVVESPAAGTNGAVGGFGGSGGGGGFGTRSSGNSLSGRTSTSGGRADVTFGDKDGDDKSKSTDGVQDQPKPAMQQAVEESQKAADQRTEAVAAPPAPTTPPATEAPPAGETRKIIRNGEMEFEVDSFDSAVMQIGKIVAEEGGFLSTTESDKLPNGKVKGRVVLRCPPQRLDTLVLKLRGIGDLRTQRIGAQDVTKQYTDTESALRAAKAMQERLMDIIKNGKGAVKDLLEAEKQLGVWREKIEQLEGEIRYYNNLISLSTLSVTLMERDIRNPAFASETETVAMSLETEKVEDDYQKARDAIAEAKGRITGSELKQFDAGQYRATISALLPPDAAEAVIARVRQLDGRLAHFERQRSQSTSNGEATRADPVRTKREDVVLNLTIYNLANIAPRRTTSLLIVAPNVEEAYRNLIEQVNSSGGRVVTSTIARPKPDQTAGNVNFNVPADKADIILAALRGAGEVLKTDTSESPDTANVTESKRGFSVTISSLAAFAARETQQVQLAAPAVSDAFNEVLNAVRGKDGRVLNSQLNEQDPQNVTGTIDFEAPRDSLGAIEQAFRHSSEIVARLVTRSTDTENTVDNKVHFTLTVTSADRLPARESLTAQLAAVNVTDAYAAIRAAVPKGGHILTSELNEQDPQNVSAHLVFDLPQTAESAMQDLLKKNTAVLSRQVHRVPEGQVAVDKLRVELTLVAADRQPPRQVVHLGVQVSDVEKSGDDLIAAAGASGGRESDNPSVTQDPSGHTSSTITVDVPADKLQGLLDQIDRLGNRRTRQVGLNTQVPETRLSRAQVQVTFSDSAASLGGQESMADYVRNGLMTSLKGLGYSLMWIIIGVCLIAPWVLLIWGAWRLARRGRKPSTAQAT
jgi:anti-sigma factor RsiW/glycine cleavage system regulatory protein